jgi:hypothetical protein
VSRIGGLRTAASDAKLDESSVVPPRSAIDAASPMERDASVGAPRTDGHEPSRGVVTSALTSPGGPGRAHEAAPHGAMGARMAALTGAVLDRSTHGTAALAARFDEIEALVREGKKVRCVFDLDNTLFDTRARTLFCAKQYDEEHGTSYFAGLTLDQVKLDGRATATALGLPDSVIEDFGAHWDHNFWVPEHLVHDLEMRPILEIVAEAQRRGAEVVFLTGRAERFLDKDGVERGFREATRAQLERAGLAVDDAQIVLKPGLDVRTAPFKADRMRTWQDDGVIGFFLTEGRYDIEHVSKTMTDLALFLLDSSLEEGGPACEGVPVLPRIY